VLGTPQYIALEQFEGKEQATDKEAGTGSHIWAFGAGLYEMVTGQKAFQGNNYSSLVAAILSADPPAMAVKPFTPAWLERLVRRCLAKDPSDDISRCVMFCSIWNRRCRIAGICCSHEPVVLGRRHRVPGCGRVWMARMDEEGDFVR
jgi:eukaryotic-like serine/threonine-protein kinase